MERVARDSRRSKYCFVPGCKNTGINSKKLFLSLPENEERKVMWFEAAGRIKSTSKSKFYCCEDHFNLEEDVDNYMRYKMMGGNIILKPDVIPHVFQCIDQNSRSKIAATTKKLQKQLERKLKPNPSITQHLQDDSQFRLPLYSDHSYRLTSPYDFVAVNDRLEATSTKTSDTLLGDIKIEEDPLNLHESCEDVGTSDVRIKTEIDCFDAKRQEFDESPGPSELHCFPIKNEIEPWQFRETNGNCEIEEVFCDNLKLEIEVGDVIKTELEES